MSKLASHAEIVKLAATFDVDPSELDFLAAAPAEPIRLLREAVNDYLLDEDRPLFRGLARIIERLPVPIAARIGLTVDPLLVAGVAIEAPARRAVQIALRLPTPFLADVCTYLDPRRARELIRLLPADRIIDIALELDSRDDFVTMSRFVDYLDDAIILSVEEAIHDETRLLRITYLMESKNRVDHIFRMLPTERIQRLLIRIQDDPDALLAEFLSLLVHVSFGFKRELGDVLAAQDEALIDRYIRGVDQQALWTDVLPVVAAMSEPSRRRVVNLPALRDHSVQTSILRTAQSTGLWGQVLALVGMMGDDNREAVAGIIGADPDLPIDGPTHAALIGEYWDVLLDLIVRMPEAKQREFGRALADIGTIDPSLRDRVLRLAGEHGIPAGRLSGSEQPVA